MQSTGAANKKRIQYLLLFYTAAILALLIFRVGYWQIVRAEWLQEKALNQWTRESVVSPERGTIYDRNEKVLANSASADMVVVRPQMLVVKNNAEKTAAQQDQVAQGLAAQLGLTYDSVILKVRDTSKSEVLIKRQLTRDQANALRQLNLPGVYLSEDTKRYYPNGNFLTQVLGFTSVDGEGLEGLETRFNKYLKGTPGSVTTETDAKSRELPYSVDLYVPPVDGADISLTIDVALQSFVEKAAEQCLDQQKAKRVMAIMMNPQTGEILAMANKPDFNNNEPPRDDMDTLRALVRNGVISDSYEPGSTFKVLTLAAGLDSGAVNKGSGFNCPGYWFVDGQKIKCWSNRPHGSETLAEGVQNSCNPVFMQIALRLGRDKFYDYLYNFGLGKTTGIELYGEASGIVTAPKYVRNTDLARIGFGQSIAVTPLQLLTAVSAAINGGNLMQPYLVKNVVDNGEVIMEGKPTVVRQVISPETSQTVRELLRGVVTDGGGKAAQIPGYSVGGKTGTAQKYDENGKILPNIHISSFFGFAPVNDPEIAILLVVDEPGVSVDFGSIVAAPYVKLMLEDSLKYLNVPPDDPETVSQQGEVEVPDVTNGEFEQASKTLQDKGLKYLVEGVGGKVVAQVPPAGSKAMQGSTVLLCLEHVDDANEDVALTMPDLFGKTAIEANNTLISMGLKLRIKGVGGVVQSQVPAAGETVFLGETVELTFARASDEEDTTSDEG